MILVWTIGMKNETNTFSVIYYNIWGKKSTCILFEYA